MVVVAIMTAMTILCRYDNVDGSGGSVGVAMTMAMLMVMAVVVVIMTAMTILCQYDNGDGSGGSVGVTIGNGYVDGDGSDDNGGGGDNDGNDNIMSI